MLDIVAYMHDVLHCSALTVLALAGDPNQPIVGPIRRPGILMSNDVIYGDASLEVILCPVLTFGDQLKEVTGKIQ